jgi:hypothetical protein
LDALGHRVDFDASARAIVRRPNKIFSERRGEQIEQNFFYDGKTLTLCNPLDKVYATVPAPPTINGALDYVRDTLGLMILVSDLVYTNSFELLMKNVSYAAVVGKSVVNGFTCDHLLFVSPGVEFQVFVADSNPPLPMKYVVTDISTCARLSVSTVMSKWDLTPDAPDSLFTFVPPKGAKPITFMPLYTTTNTNR